MDIRARAGRFYIEHAPHLGTNACPIQGGGDTSQEGSQMILGILLANTVVGAMAKHKVIGRKLDVLATLGAEALRVKLLWVLVTL